MACNATWQKINDLRFHFDLEVKDAWLDFERGDTSAGVHLYYQFIKYSIWFINTLLFQLSL